MEGKTIHGDMKVWDVLERYPQTYEVFMKHGCPDMRTGIYSVSARIMKVRWAAKMHKITPEELVRDLNEIVKATQGQNGEGEAA